MTTAVSPNLSKARAEQARLERGTHFHWFHWLVIIASLFLTLGAWYIASGQHRAQVKSQYDREVERTIALVSERMEKYEDSLWAGTAVLQSSGFILTPQTWRDYSQALEIETKYPGINGIGIIDHVSPDEFETYLTEQRRERPDFKVFPEHTQPEYFPITYIEPVETNGRAVGLDVAHESNRYRAAQMARDSGQAQITGPITLVQDSQQTPGFLFYAPYYKAGIENTVEARREGFSAMVYAPFIFGKLMEGTLRSDQRHIGLTISDDDMVLFDENRPGDPEFDPKPIFKTAKTIEMYGRQWHFDIWSQKSFRVANGSNKPWFILLGGILIDILIFCVFSLMVQTNKTAVKFGRQMASAFEENSVRLSSIIDNAVDGLVTIDEAGTIQSYNKACENIFRRPATDAIGLKLSELLPGLTAVGMPELGATVEVSGLRKDGSRFPAEYSANAINLPDQKIYNAIIRDITERKAREHTIARAMEDLKLTNEELEKFAYIASHDLKSPLRAIDNLSYWIEEDLAGKIDDENKTRLQQLRGRVRRMETLLGDLLAYARAGAKFDGTNRVAFKNLIAGIEVVLEVPEGFTIRQSGNMADVDVPRMPLEQLFHNLINNAIKHHDKKSGTISITAKDEGAFYHFVVADDGPGIDPQYHEKIFGMFQTLRPRDEVEGSGMGLALVKKIIHRYGGRISIVSQPGHGAAFTFTWPKNPEEKTYAV